MGPYLTRKRTSSTSNSKETQSEDKSSRSKTASKTKGIIDKTSHAKPVSKTKSTVDKNLTLQSTTKVIGTRSVTLAKRTGSRKTDGTNSQSEGTMQNEKQRRMRNGKLLEKNINNRPTPKKIITRSGAAGREEEVKDSKRKINKRINKNVSNSRQMSLKESFLNQSKIKVLRSSTNSAKIKKDSALVKETLKKKSNISKTKHPIYECPLPEKPTESNSEIYEFKFDINDTKERLPKRRKKRATVKKTLANKKRKSISTRYNSQGAKVRKLKPSTEKTQKDKETDPVESEQNKNTVDPITENENDGLQEDLLKNSNKDMEIDKESKVPEESNDALKTQTVDNEIAKPVVISVHDVSDKTIKIMGASRVSNSNDFRPFRPTNIFANRLTLQQKNSLNHSSLEKSLSPIMKSSENPQINSPWRASPVLAFSQVKNVFQSTPHNNKYDISSRRFVRTLNNESKQYGTPTRIRNNFHENNENISTERRNTPKLKTPSTSRKFGTEITNIDHSLQSNVAEQVSERITSDVESIQPSIESNGTITSNVNNIIKFDNNENKRGNNISSPQKDVKNGTTKIQLQTRQENVLGTSAVELKEIYDPQPGPSGLQKRSVLSEQRILRQSNLNNYLNVMEVPQSTTISTRHGIFDDAESTPVSGRVVKKLNNSKIELENAFGFDDDTNQDMPIPGPEIISNEVGNVLKPIVGSENIKKAARLSIGEIKNKLQNKKFKDDPHDKENIHTENTQTKPLHSKKNKAPIDAANFSDTFDIISEADDASISVSDIPLFVDYEPTRFRQPPRHSYKRKRAVKFSFSEGESGEEEEEELMIEEHAKKRKKADKLKKGQEERLTEWVKSINRTFNEIDEHELLIE